MNTSITPPTPGDDVTDDQITALREHARKRNDTAVAALCDVALGKLGRVARFFGGPEGARREIAEIIAAGGLPPRPRPPAIDRTPSEPDPVTGVEYRAVDPWHALPGAAVRVATVRWHATADHPAAACRIRVSRDDAGRPVLEIIDAAGIEVKHEPAQHDDVPLSDTQRRLELIKVPGTQDRISAFDRAVELARIPSGDGRRTELLIELRSLLRRSHITVAQAESAAEAWIENRPVRGAQ